jgi:hypothetical protein
VEKSEKEIKDLVRRVLGMNVFSGRVSFIKTPKGERRLAVWSQGFVPQIMFRIDYNHDIFFVTDKKYLEKAERVASIYENIFLRAKGQYVDVKKEYRE